MSLVDSRDAIGAVSDLLKTALATASGISAITVGRPEEAAKAAQSGQGSLNLFLYRVAVDGDLRNRALDAGQSPPVWLVLHYLLTAFDGPDSDSIAAHRLLGRGIRGLNALSVLKPGAAQLPLAASPDPLRITLDEADVEMLSRVMQGSDEKYRVSAGFQVRPVMVASTDEPPAYAPPVRTIGQPAPAPRMYDGVTVLPGLGAVASSIEPERFEAGQAFVVRGTGFAGYDQIQVGPHVYPATATPDGGLTATIAAADAIEPGAYPVCVARALPGGRLTSSNAVTGRLSPRITAVNLAGALTVVGTKRSGSFDVLGSQLSGPNSAAYAALYLDGQSRLLLEPQPGGTPSSLTFVVDDDHALPPSTEYRVILRVNGQQAFDTPQLHWT
ncbi:hypothetical protein CDL60_19550 [Roseateles noduli]|nr:hypothetical protein CDL60_19550 [Roseateles noduli]